MTRGWPGAVGSRWTLPACPGGSVAGWYVPGYPCACAVSVLLSVSCVWCCVGSLAWLNDNYPVCCYDGLLQSGGDRNGRVCLAVPHLPALWCSVTLCRVPLDIVVSSPAC